MRVEQRYPASVSRVGQVLADEAFVRWRAERSGGSGSEVMQVDVTGTPDHGFTVTVRRTLPSGQIPAQARPFVGSRLEIRQVEAWEPEHDGVRRGTVSLEITGAPVRLTGTVTLASDSDPGSDAPSTVQEYDGEVRASLPLFASAIEDAAATAVRAALSAEEAAGQHWLAG
nr:DUF2505 domain-containing protein [Cellulosimicrobium arenosum]